MFKTEIKVEGKTIPIQFGAYVIHRLEEDGLLLTEFENLSKKPVGLTVKLIQYGAINADKNFNEDAITKKEIYAWIDEVGITSKEFVGIIELFAKSFTHGVPQEEEEKKSGNVKKKQ